MKRQFLLTFEGPDLPMKLVTPDKIEDGIRANGGVGMEVAGITAKVEEIEVKEEE